MLNKFIKVLLSQIIILALLSLNVEIILAEEFVILPYIPSADSILPEDLEFNIVILNNGVYTERVLKQNEILELELEVKNTGNEIKDIQFFMALWDTDDKMQAISLEEANIEAGKTEKLNLSKLISYEYDIKKATVYLWDNYNREEPYALFDLSLENSDYYPDSFDSAVKISDISKHISGGIDAEGDEDYIKFTVPSTEEYFIQCFGVPGDMHLNGYLYNSNKSLMESGSGNGQYSISENLTAGQTYYLNTSSSDTGEYFIKILPSQEIKDFNLYDYDIENNVYKNKIKSLCEKALDEGNNELSQEIYNKFEMAYDIDVVLHEMPEFLKNTDSSSSNYETIVNNYYATKKTEFEDLKQNYLSILSEYSSEPSTLLTEPSETYVRKDENKPHVCGVEFGMDFPNEEIEETKISEDETEEISEDVSIMPMSLGTLRFENIGTGSISYQAVFPVSNDVNNRITLMDYNNGITKIIENPEGSSKLNGSRILTNLTSGGVYGFQMSWYYNGSPGYIFRRVKLNDTPTNNWVEEEGEHVIAKLEYRDRVLTTDENFSRWLSHMDSTYEALQELTGYTPQNGDKFELRSTTDDLSEQAGIPNSNGNYITVITGISGNPTLISRPFYRSLMLRLRDRDEYDDWGDTPIHELSHGFDMADWEFDPEVLADLKLSYVLQSLPGSRIYRWDTEKSYTGSNIYNFFYSDQVLSYYDTMKVGEYSSRGMTAVMLGIKDKIGGWQPFKDTFRYMSNLSSDELDYIYARPYSDEIGKFNIFMTKLKDFSGRDVISELNATEKRCIKEQYGGEVEYYTAPPADISGGGGASNINMPAGKYAMRRFTPTVTGSYDIFTSNYSGTGVECDTKLTVYGDEIYSEEKKLGENDNYGSSKFSKVTVNLQKNQTYYIKIEHAQNKAFLADLKIAKTPISLALEQSAETQVTGLESAMYKFTPSVNGVYIFKTEQAASGSNTENIILELYKNELLTERIAASRYEANVFPQMAAYLKAGVTYYLTFSGYLSRPAKAKVNIKKGLDNIRGISNVSYNGEIGAMIGSNNLLKFTINRTTSNDVSYYIVPSLGWDKSVFYDKKDNGITVNLSGTSTNVTIKDIPLSGGSGENLYTKIKIYDNNSANKTLLWEGPNPAVSVKAIEAALKTIHLDDDYNAYQKIDLTAKNTILKIDRPIPAGKVLVVSYFTIDITQQYGVSNASDFIDRIYLYDENYNLYERHRQRNACMNTRMAYFKIEDEGIYNVKIPLLKDSPASGYLSIYTVDYVGEINSFRKMDSLEEKPGADNNYLIINSPEHLWRKDPEGRKEDRYQLAEDHAYISKMNVRGNANIYWEHLNKYGKTMRYGILLHNTTGETVGFKINKKGIGNTYNNINFTAPIQPWLEYFKNIIRADLTNINSNDTIYIENGGFRWIYLEDIPGSNESVGIVFNGIINLSILGGKNLDCYAFIMNSGYQYTFEADFINNYNSYVKAKDDGDSLSGTTNGPVLESNIGTLDLSDNKKFRLLFTGYEAPYLNAGELMELKQINGVRENAQNYSVVYKLNIDGIIGKNDAKVVFKYNPYTAPAYVDDIHSGIYVICAIDGGIVWNPIGRVILTPEYNLCEDIEVSLPSGPFSMYVVVSGMSTTPLTVSFE